MLSWDPYLRSLCKTYAKWWECYTLTDVVGKQAREQKQPTPLLHDLMVEMIDKESDNSTGEKQEKTERFTVLEGLRKYAEEHVLLIGRPGSGKSTALLRLLLESAEVVIASEAKRNEAISTTSEENEQITVLVELRFYKTSILDLIRDFLLRHDPNLPMDGRDVKFNVSTLLRQGKFILLFDGVNELSSEAARQDLQKFRQDYRKTTPMIFTTRDLGVGGDLGIEKKLRMQPLTESQMQEFVCGYLPEQGEEMLKQLSGRLRELGETPLLLMMLCSVFVDNQNKVPSNLGSVFRRFTEIYDNQLKQDIPVTDESRRWWKRLLQHLAWVMTKGESKTGELKTEILVAIPIQKARDILTRFLNQQDYHQPRNAEKWLDDLLKHHLIQLGAKNQIQFRHQLLQEYYAAERLLAELPKLSDDELQWGYLNYLKWTEPVALMMQLVDNQSQVLRLVKLALEIDWQLGARLAGEVKEEWQDGTIGLIDGLEIPPLLKIRLLDKTKSESAIPELIKLLEHENLYVRWRAADALGEIKSEAAISELIKLLEHEDLYVRKDAADVLGKIKSEEAISELIKLLEHEDLYVRRNTADVLGKIKYEEAVPDLIKLLEHEDLYVRRNAAYALGEIKSEEAVPDLIKLLEHEDVYVLRNAEGALGKIKSQSAINRLIKLLNHENSEVRTTTACLLGEIKSEEAVPGLLKILKNEDAYVRKRGAYALGEIKSEKAIPELIKLLEDEDAYVRKSAAEALGKIKSEEAITELITLLEHEDSDISYHAANVLGEIKSQAAIDRLIKLLNHENSEVRITTACLLGEIKSEEAVPGLLKLLEDKDAYVREKAASALGEIKSEEAVPELIKLLEDEDSEVRKSAAEAVGNIKSEEAVPELIKLLEDEDSEVRKSAADALGNIKSEEAVPELLKLLNNEDSYVRRRAADALGNIKSEEAVLELIKLLEDEDSYVRLRTTDALGKTKSETAIPGLIKFLEDEDLYVRRRAVSALEKVKSEAAIPGLIKLLEDKDSYLRWRAASALVEIKSEAAIPELIKLLDDEDSDVRRRAVSALGKIKPEAAVPGLIQLLEDEDSDLSKRAANALGEIKSEAAIPELIKILEDEDSSIRNSAASALGEIKSEAAIPGLIKLLNNQNFLQLNNGKHSLYALETLEKIQQHLKYYKPIPKPIMSKSTSHNYALLIGVGECEETKLSLPVTVKDIQAVKTLLTDSNLCAYTDNNIRLLYNETATKEKILENLTWLKQQAENDPEATILIYYSGHGWLNKSTNNYYLIPHDTDRADIPDTALSAETLNQALREIPAQRLLVIIDSCHAQGMATSKDDAEKNQRSPIPKSFTQTALPKTIIDDLKGTGRVVFTSSTGTQLSWIRKDGEMSIYTYHFLEALQGAGNQPGDKVVKVSHLMNYLSETVPITVQKEYNKEQTPFFDFATEDFPVALLCGGKGLPKAGYESVKAEAEENIRSISNQVNDGVGIVGDRSIGLKIDSGGGNVTISDISSS